MPTVTSADGTTIAYETVGAGPALILVDGALCYRGQGPSRDLAAALADTYTVYCYDRRGRGDSGDTPPWSADREIEDLAALLAAAGGTAYLFGASSGAVLAADAAARNTSAPPDETPWTYTGPSPPASAITAVRSSISRSTA